MYYKLDLVRTTVSHRTAFRKVIREVNPVLPFPTLGVISGDGL